MMASDSEVRGGGMIEEPVTSVASNGCVKTSGVEIGAFRSSTEPFQNVETSDNELDDDEDFEEDGLEDGDEDDDNEGEDEDDAVAQVESQTGRSLA
jgi:hypothetical protein